MINTALSGNLDRVGYYIEGNLLIHGSERVIPVNNILALRIVNDYHNKLMADIRCVVAIDRKDFIAMQNKTIDMILKIDDFIINKDAKVKRKCIDKIFRVEDIYQTTNEDYRDMNIRYSNQGEDESVSDDVINLTLSLIDYEFIKSYRITTNGIYKGTVNSVIARECFLRQLSTLYSPSDNNKPFTMMSPPYNINALIKYIDSRFGMYEKSEAIVFNEIDRFYIINPYNLQFEPKEVQNVNIIIEQFKGGVEEGGVIGSTGYVVRTIRIPQIRNLEDINPLRYTGIDVSNPHANTLSLTNKIDRIPRTVVSKSPYIQSILDTKSKENHILQFELSDVYMDMIRLNKRYNIFDQTQIEDSAGNRIIIRPGEYRLAHSIMAFSQEGIDTHNIDVSITLIRKDQPDE